MAENTNSAAVEREVRVWSAGQIGTATFVGGPLGGLWLLARNLQLLGSPKSAKQVKLAAIVTTFLLPVLALCLPALVVENIPNSFFPMIYTGMVSGYAHYAHKGRVKELLESGAKKGSGWKLAGWALLSLVITTVVYFGVLILAYSVIEGV